MIENLKKENLKIGILGICLALATLYSLIFDFDSYAWIMIGFFAWCCFTYIKGNFKAIEFYENQNEKHKIHENQIMEAIK